MNVIIQNQLDAAIIGRKIVHVQFVTRDGKHSYNADDTSPHSYPYSIVFDGLYDEPFAKKRLFLKGEHIGLEEGSGRSDTYVAAIGHWESYEIDGYANRTELFGALEKPFVIGDQSYDRVKISFR